MKQIYALLITVYCLLYISCVSATPYYRYQTKAITIKGPPDIQVLLTATEGEGKVSISTTSDYKVYQYTFERQKHFLGAVIDDRREVTNGAVYSKNGSIYFDNHGLKSDDIVIKPYSGLVTIGIGKEKRSYRGMLRIKALGNSKVLVGNILDLESYLYGVIGSEMDTSYPSFALAAQAIASRTFALFKIKETYYRLGMGNNKPEADFDVTANIYSQVYRGEERADSRAIEAVNTTRGVYLEYNGKIIYSIFHDTCGGATEPGDVVFGLTLIPPLHGVTCGFCYHSKFSNWKASFSEREIIEKLKADDVKRIDEIMAARSAPGGHITSIGLKVSNDYTKIMDAQKFRIALDPNRLRSTKLKVVKDGDMFEFTGEGWGHAVGLCQEGANGMALKDFNTLQILEYYYPECRVVKIY
ncbi:MAG: SpoIID/LytB domain-containing protein [Planctomycetes bacterium]|nr:SpoIID/LytB domain-containing protein [Planctomycetota bacterium]